MSINKRSIVVSIGLLSILTCTRILAQSQYPGQHADKLNKNLVSPIKAFAFDLKEVRLLDSPFTEKMELHSKWIHSLGVDRLLHSFRTNAGVYAGLEGGYDRVEKLGGWESLDCELRGHTTGHILSSLALFYASTGNIEHKQLSDSLVKGLSEVQSALNQEGYLSAFPQNLIDRNIAGQRVWAPWYTLHKLLSGLIDQYLYCDNREALKIASGMGHWAFKKLSVLSSEQRKRMLRNEFGGMNDAFYALYAITSDEQFHWLGDFFYHEDVLDPLKEAVDNLENKHANTLIPKLIGLVRAYEMGASEENKTIADFFWNTVVDHHTFVTGGNSDKEKFFKPDHQSKHLSGYTGETCNVYNMLKLTRHLFCLEADVKLADYYEKALFNHILGQQDPSSGMVSYFLPMLPGAHKVYSTYDQSFWCCVGTSFESYAKFGEAIYYHKDSDVFVNLFIPSRLKWKDQGVEITQQTQFPKTGKSIFTIHTDADRSFTLNLRYPSWATNGVSLRINGQNVVCKENPGSYIHLRREWKQGDRIELDFPMSLHIEASDDNQWVSILYGPIVLAAELGTDQMENPAPFSDPRKHNDYYTYDYKVPTHFTNTLATKGKPVSDWLLPVLGQAMIFKTDATLCGNELRFRPIFDLHHQRYSVYWKLE